MLHEIDTMAPPPRFLFAHTRKALAYRPGITSIVLYGLEVGDGLEGPYYLEIRFLDYETLRSEGDHLMFSLEEAMEAAEADYGILPGDWREMDEAEVARIHVGQAS
ncbi:hypothetical protein D3C73_676440 [compost metagenome]